MNDKIKVIMKWVKMLNGKSVFHMPQKAGYYYSKNSVEGYYSDLRHKVLGDILLDSRGVPINLTNRNDEIYFAITIFQFGLGAYDIYIETKDNEYLQNFNNAVNWAVENQNVDGSWDAFGWSTPEFKYSSMAQGEGASLLIRAYLVTGDIKYFYSAKKAIDFMVKPIEEGGTTKYYPDGGVTFEEKLNYTTILNGVVFSIWGLHDFCLVSKEAKYKELLERSVKKLSVILPQFDCGYWSNYDLDGNITSAFYHDLHIEQLKVMYDLFENKIFLEYIKKWEKYQKSSLNSKRAFFNKGLQKIKTINNDIALVK